MRPVGFFTAVNYGNHCHSLSEFLLEKVDDYFFLWGRKVQVIPGYAIGNSQGVDWIHQPAHFLKTALKIASYIIVPIPLILLLVKGILRATHSFHFIDKRPPVSWLPLRNGNDLPPLLPNDDRPFAPTPPNKDRLKLTEPKMLPFDVPTRLTAEETSKLKIAPVGGLNSGVGFSEHEYYQDSKFYFRQIEEGYEVTRKKIGSLGRKLLFDRPTELSTEQMCELKILARKPPNFGSGFSILEEFQDSEFQYISTEKGYTVTRKRIERDYPFLPFNTPVRLLPQEHERLNMIDPVHFQDPSGLHYMRAGSTIPEYENSEIIFYEARNGGQGCVYTRVLKEF